jgi:hypothetical protein
MSWYKRLKSIFIYLIFPFVILYFFSLTVSAQTEITAQGWFCAKTTWCGEDNANCTVKHEHRVRLEVDSKYPLQPNIDETYLVECISYTKDNQLKWLCTTGGSDVDQAAFGSDNFSQLQRDIDYSLSYNESYGIYKVVNNQAIKIGAKTYTTRASSNILIIKDSGEAVSSFEWQSRTPQVHDRKYYFFQKFPATPNPEVGAGGQQQATSFDWINADQDCAIIRWDPAGRVFDAYSLEPIPGAQVFLTKKNNQGEFIDASLTELGIVNPQFTNTQGGFSYYVSDGDYKLSIQNMVLLGYQRMVTSSSEVNPKYDRIYFYDEKGIKRTFLYPSQTGEVIEQRGKLEYRDIPLIPTFNYPQGRSYPLKVISGFQSVDRITGNITFEGTVSHPFTLIKIYGLEKGKEGVLIFQGTADNLGHYKIIFSQQKGKQVFDQFRVDFEKVNLRLITRSDSLLGRLFTFLFNRGKTFAQEITTDSRVSFTLDPIPTYIEGVAYDRQGKILANKEIAVYLQGSNIPYAVVYTDSNGVYRLGSNQLPALPYYLKYQTTTGNSIIVSTPQLIADNKQFLLTKNINLYTLKNNQGKSINLSPQPSLTSSPTSNQDMVNQPSSINQGVILILAIIFSLILIIAVVFYFYWRQKKTSFDY